jgi:hypothetical protein
LSSFRIVRLGHLDATIEARHCHPKLQFSESEEIYGKKTISKAYLGLTDWHLLSNDIADCDGFASHLQLELFRRFPLSFDLCIKLFFRSYEVIRRLFRLSRNQIISCINELQFSLTYLLLRTYLLLYSVNLLVQRHRVKIHCNNQ